MKACESAISGSENIERYRGAAEGLLARFMRARRGATAIEFALLAPILFVMIMGTIELGLVLAADMVLKNATYNASRTGRTGFVAEESTRGATITELVHDRAGLLMDASRVKIESRVYATFGAIRVPGASDDPEDEKFGVVGYGGAQQVVLYTVTYPWTFVTPLVGRMFSEEGVLTLKATAVVQNEPY